MLAANELFSALANETRLRCLVLIAAQGELCVCELTHALETVQPKVSRHLAQLREAGVVSDRRDGLWVYYRIHPDLPEWARQVLKAVVIGLGEAAPYADDRQRLEQMPNRPGARCCA